MEGGYQSLDILLRLFLLDCYINIAGWAVSAVAKTHKTYDLVGSIAYLTCCALSLYNSDLTVMNIIQSSCIMLWAFRLGSYLFYRAIKRGDARMEKYDNAPIAFLVPFILQIMWVFVMSCPTYLANRTPQTEVTPYSYVGWAIFLVGFIFEAVSDFQKARFLNDESKRGQFIKTGLWSISRHPNYFGEVLLWSGLYVSAAGSFTYWPEFISGLSIFFIYGLLRFVSGIPMLEENGRRKWGETVEYQQYCEKVPVFVPFVPIYK